tara:strand:+ start:175 stop:495 length:321 start_codon:yes stop_codon:yes gene_type:complete
MKYIRLFLLLNLILLFTHCSTAQKAFVNQKKNSTDEFLVEKKKPLVMPPDYNDLPIPKEKKILSNMEESNLEILLKNNNNQISKDSDLEKTSNNFEESLLKKIKKN